MIGISAVIEVIIAKLGAVIVPVVISKWTPIDVHLKKWYLLPTHSSKTTSRETKTRREVMS